MEIENEYYKNNLESIFDSLIGELINTKPNDPIKSSLNFLIKKANIEDILDKPLNIEEKKELYQLRIKYANLQKDKKASLLSIIAKKKRKSISAEAYGIYNKFEGFTTKKYPKSEDQINNIYNNIKNCIFFGELSKKNTNIIIDAMKNKIVQKDEIIIKEGTEGESFYFLDSGKLACYKIIKGENTFLRFINPGNFFGELALLYNTKRAATIISVEPSTLWELDRETFKFIVRFQHEQKQTKYIKFLRSIEIFSTLNENNLRQISEALKTIKVKENNVIIRAGDYGDEFYIIEKGSAYATIIDANGNHKHLKSYEDGNFFGELALLRQTPRACNIFAKVSLNNYSKI